MELTAQLSRLTGKEIEALKEAVAVIYLNDSSDYINGLWGVVSAILGEVTNDESFRVDDVYKALETRDAAQGDAALEIKRLKERIRELEKAEDNDGA